MFNILSLIIIYLIKKTIFIAKKYMHNLVQRDFDPFANYTKVKIEII